VVETAFDYDLANRLTGLTHTHDSSTLAAYGLTLDAAGQVTAFSGQDEGSGAATATYDNTGQLTGVDHQSLDDESYAYDENGNRTGTGYVTATDNRLESDGTYTYDYDAEGNLVSKTKTNVTGNEVKYTTYSWDYRNRLTEIVC
jgi:YD repeat-containing protein